MKSLPHPALVAARLSYDPATGIISHKLKRHGVRVGMIAGSKKHAQGYVTIKIDQRACYAHRVAWCLHYKKWPKGHIDHVNGDTSDNRIANLREADVTQNRANCRHRKDASTPFKGITKVRGDRWRAQITKGGKSTYLGQYADPAEAHAAYVRAAKCLFGEFSNAG